MSPRSLLVSLCAALCAAACGGGPAQHVAIESDECYALSYIPNDADSVMFPTAFALRAGPDSGGVARPAENDGAFWGMFGGGAAWRRLPTDSIRIAFSNDMSAVVLVVAHDGNELEGTSAFYFEKGGEPHPVLDVSGSRVDCAG